MYESRMREIHRGDNGRVPLCPRRWQNAGTPFFPLWRNDMIVRTTTFALALAAAFVAQGAFAVPNNDGTVDARESAPEWSKADSNRDGFLTKEELVSYPTLGNDFDDIDTDGDNKLSESEYTTWMQMDHDMKKRDRM